MYKLLVVDDERIIVDGISRMIDWSKIGIELAGTARNGVEALEKIRNLRPDIVISDIRMPGLDGLQLAEEVREYYPDIQFILLSGFSEFDYARKAMQFGVRHYLLKPSSEQAIIEAVQEVVDELIREQSREQFMQRIQSELIKVLPHAKEQFLKEFVTNKTYGKRDWDYYKQLFGIPLDQRQVRLILFQPEGEVDYEHLFALTNIAGDWLGKPRLLLSTTIGRSVLLLTADEPKLDSVLGLIENIRATFHKFYKLDTTIALSGSGDISDARQLYMETLECLSHRFYLGEGSVIMKQDIDDHSKFDSGDFYYDEDNLCLLVKAGRLDEVNTEIDALFDSMAYYRMHPEVAKSYVVTLYMAVVRGANALQTKTYMSRMTQLVDLDTLSGLKDFMKTVASSIAAEQYEANRSKHSAMINKVLTIIDENMANPALSLQVVAGEMLYMNADYLGKLFKKEMGDKFSNYVMKQRMEKAIALIEQMDDVKVFELADMLGFADNPQYFSQVFKKYTGYTPSEYKKTL